MRTQREKEQTEVAVEESFPFRETAPPDEPLVTAEESWVVKLEQSVNIFLTVISTSQIGSTSNSMQIG
jgi:ubiquinol oxidase